MSEDTNGQKVIYGKVIDYHTTEDKECNSVAKTIVYIQNRLYDTLSPEDKLLAKESLIKGKNLAMKFIDSDKYCLFYDMSELKTGIIELDFKFDGKLYRCVGQHEEQNEVYLHLTELI